MANPTEPYTIEEIEGAVRQARNMWAANLTDGARRRCIGYWMPFLLAKIDELEADGNRVYQDYKEAREAQQKLEAQLVGNSGCCVQCEDKEREVQRLRDLLSLAYRAYEMSEDDSCLAVDIGNELKPNAQEGKTE